MAELALRFRLDLVQQAWDGFQAGRFASEVGEQIGVNRTTAKRMLIAAGGVRPRRGRGVQGRYLSFLEREEIAVGVAAGESVRSIARRLGRAPSTVSRELSRNAVRGRYRASLAQMSAFARASRPKTAKLATNLRLRARVERDLAKRRSPEQISGRLRREFPDDPEMQVSTETIYQSLYVQSRGALKQQLTRYLRTGRALRHPSRKVGQRKNRIPNMVNISQRPPQASDRAVPGSWEGDLIIGRRNLSAIGTLVERHSNFTMLVPLPDGYKPDQVAPALTRKIQQLPVQLRGALTGIKARRCGTGNRSASTPASRCSSATRTRPGSGASTRTPTGCCGSTSRKAPASTGSPRASSTPSPANSMTALASGSSSRPRMRSSDQSCCDDRLNPPTRKRPPLNPTGVRPRDRCKRCGNPPLNR